MRRSAASQSSRAVARSPASAAMRASASRAKTSTWAVVVAPGLVEDAPTSVRSAPGARIRGVHGGQQAFAERGLLAAARGAVPRSGLLERRPRPRDRVRARAGHVRGGPGRAPPGARHRWPRPCRSRAPGWRRRRRSRRPGTAPARGWRAGTPRSAGSRAVATSPRPGRCGRRRRRSGAGCGPARRASPRGGRAATGRRRSRSQCST